MKFLHFVKSYTILGKIPPEQIKEEVNIFSVKVKIEQHKQDLRGYLNRSEETRIKTMALKYKKIQDDHLKGIFERLEQYNCPHPCKKMNMKFMN